MRKVYYLEYIVVFGMLSILHSLAGSIEIGIYWALMRSIALFLTMLGSAITIEALYLIIENLFYHGRKN